MQHTDHDRPPSPPRQSGQKPVLPMVQLPIYRVKQRHLEAYLAKVYRMDDFDFLLAAGATPGMCPEYLVSPALPPACGAQQEADRIRRGHRSRNVALILNVLCLDGYIPAGRYTIDTHPEPPPGQVYRALLIEDRRSQPPPVRGLQTGAPPASAFTQLAAQMDKAVLEAQRGQK